MKPKTTCLTGLLLSLVSFLLPAQEIINTTQPSSFTIQGIISDSSNRETLVGVNVYLKGTRYLTVSNSMGYYALSAPAGDYQMVFTYIGYKLKEVELKLNRDLNIQITLNPSITEVEEVRITSQRKFFGNMDYGREIPTINAKEIQNQNANNASDILHARLSGVWATKTSGAPGDHEKIRIRGQNSFFSSAEPLYVVDGVPVPIVNLSSLGIADLNIHDIENVTVLKDASSTALYGFQGGNGVVLIDTKKGGENEISFLTKIGYQWFDNFYDLMSSKDQIVSLDSARNKRISYLTGFYPHLSDTICNKDRQKDIFSPGSVQEYQLSASGTKGLLKYYFSGNYTDQVGILPNAEYKRYTFSTRIGRLFWKRLALDLAYRGSVQKNKNNQDEYKGNRLIFEGISKSPCLECTPDSLLYNADGLENVRIFYNYQPINRPELPQTIIDNNSHRLDISTHAASSFARLMITEHLNIDVMESFMIRHSYYNNNIGDIGVKLESREDVILFNHQVNLSYYNNFGKHNIGIVLANRYYKDNLWWHVDSLEGTIPEHYSLKNSMAAYGMKGSVLRQMSSYVGNISYNYRKTWFISIISNVSQVKEGLYINYYSLFPSVALSWDIAQVKPFRDIHWLNNLDVFINWGQSGNYPLNGLANDIYEDVPYTNGENTIYYPSVKQFANHYLRHENTTEIDFGIKCLLLQERLQLNAVYYRKSINDLIIQRNIPYYYGGGKQFYNIGEVDVKGIDLGIVAKPVKKHNFSWELMINYSSSEQKVKKLDGEPITFTDGDILMPEFKIIENEAMGNIYGYKFMGKMTDEDWNSTSNQFVQIQGGKFLNADSTDNNLTESDKIILGNSIPDFTWNFTNSFQYRNFTVDFTLYSAWGLQKYNATRAATVMAATNREVNQYIADTLSVIRASYFYESSVFIEDASFIKLKNLTITYEPSQKLMGKINCRFSLSFENMLTFTKYKGYDPEATIFTDNNFSDNSIDRGSIPNPKAVYATISLKF